MTLGLDEWPCVWAAGAWHVIETPCYGCYETRCGQSVDAVGRRRRGPPPRQTRYSTADMCAGCAASIKKGQPLRRAGRRL